MNSFSSPLREALNENAEKENNFVDSQIISFKSRSNLSYFFHILNVKFLSKCPEEKRRAWRVYRFAS